MTAKLKTVPMPPRKTTTAEDIERAERIIAENDVDAIVQFQIAIRELTRQLNELKNELVKSDG